MIVFLETPYSGQVDVLLDEYHINTQFLDKKDTLVEFLISPFWLSKISFVAKGNVNDFVIDRVDVQIANLDSFYEAFEMQSYSEFLESEDDELQFYRKVETPSDSIRDIDAGFYKIVIFTDKVLSSLDISINDKKITKTLVNNGVAVTHIPVARKSDILNIANGKFNEIHFLKSI